LKEPPSLSVKKHRMGPSEFRLLADQKVATQR
jgi:hypothetical protein